MEVDTNFGMKISAKHKTKALLEKKLKEMEEERVINRIKGSDGVLPKRNQVIKKEETF